MAATYSMAFPQFRRRHLFPQSSSSSLQIYPFPSPPLTEPISPVSQSSSSSSSFQFYTPQTTTLSSIKSTPHFFLDSYPAMEDVRPNDIVTLRRAPMYSQSDESAFRKIKSSMSLSAVLNAPSNTPPDCHSQTSEGGVCGAFDGAYDDLLADGEGELEEDEEPKLKSPPETPPQVRRRSHLDLHSLRFRETLEDFARGGEGQDAETWRHGHGKMKGHWTKGVDVTTSTASTSSASTLATDSTRGSTTKSTPSRRLSLRSSQTVSPDIKKLRAEEGLAEEEAVQEEKVVPLQPKIIKLKFRNPSAVEAPKPAAGAQLPVKRGRGRPRKVDQQSGQPVAPKPKKAQQAEHDQPAIKRRRLFSGAALKAEQEGDGIPSATADDHALPPASPGAIRPRKRRSMEEPVGHPHIHRKQRIVTTSEEKLPRPSMHEHGLGLSNLGATCYINVVIQVLAHTRAVREYFLACDFARAPADASSRRPKAKPQKPKSQCVRRTRASEKTAEVLFPMLKGKLGEEFGKLIRELFFDEERKNGVASDSFWTALRANLEKEADSTMDPNVVQDAHEFLILILQALAAEEASPVVDGYTVSEIIDRTFAGAHATTFECNNCHATTRREDKCMELQVPICKKMPAHGGHLQPSALEDHLRNYTLPEHGEWAEDAFVSPEGAKKKACPACGVDKGRSMRNTVKPKGENVCIELKRFLWDCGENRKVRGHVAFPLRSLDLSICSGSLSGDDGTTASTSDVKREMDDAGEVLTNGEEKEPPTLYDLYGVVVHRGDRSNTGHYISFAKERGQWLRFDDLKVHVVPEAEVARQEAYILMYEKQPTA
ncbi:Ubiquitin carboxyl-terminal hydrolase [Drechslerella dactyloides]|uniref:Ubiquitin carboxyl-terminal hydrolase n=1 Tax=Drechslerella dactyloides TaxID=74499 RepID=A0AAD6NK23_DREDA|nr:Ubiquitin carboxyl-terminal hydrolase [Drechslerella dactyloides]